MAATNIRNGYCKGVYKALFPRDRQLPFRKTRWTIMVLVQEISMGKWKAILKYFRKKSYKADIDRLCDILSKGRLTGEKSILYLEDIHSSHEVNYPEWVDVLVERYRKGSEDYKRVKVFFLEDQQRWIVIDGNHRLQALRRVFCGRKIIKVLKISYA